MIPDAIEVRLKSKERAVLESRLRAATTEQRQLLRIRIVLEAADGFGTREIARELDTTPTTVSLWRGRFARQRLDGLDDLPRSGTPPIYSEATDKRIWAVLDRSPPKGFARWNGPLIAKALGDVDVQYVWRSLRKHKIDLGGRKSWCESNDPEFASKAADVVGLYMAPPDNAVVICVDEKPSIQALERAQGYLKLPNGRTLTGHSHDYKRHGTTTLFAAFEVATGMVTAAHKKRRRRKEFLAFMDEVVATYPKTRLEVILDNLNTHNKPDESPAPPTLGTLHYSLTPPAILHNSPASVSTQPGTAPPAENPNAAKELAKREADFHKHQTEAAEAAAKSGKERTSSAQQAESCAQAKGQLKQLAESQLAIYRYNEKGEREVMDEDARGRERAKLNAWLRDNKC